MKEIVSVIFGLWSIHRLSLCVFGLHEAIFFQSYYGLQRCLYGFMTYFDKHSCIISFGLRGQRIEKLVDHGIQGSRNVKMAVKAYPLPQELSHGPDIKLV